MIPLFYIILLKRLFEAVWFESEGVNWDKSVWSNSCLMVDLLKNSLEYNFWKIDLANFNRKNSRFEFVLIFWITNPETFKDV